VVHLAQIIFKIIKYRGFLVSFINLEHLYWRR